MTRFGLFARPACTALHRLPDRRRSGLRSGDLRPDPRDAGRGPLLRRQGVEQEVDRGGGVRGVRGGGR